MMHPGATADDWTWFRILARVQSGTLIEPLRARLDATSHAFEEERAKKIKGMSKEDIEKFLAQTVIVLPAASGVSNLQQEYGRSLAILGMLVALVLLIACANTANLMIAQAMARAREMALRVSIGASRRRLAQVVLVESAWIALLAGSLGLLFAWWAAPFVVSMIRTPDSPADLSLPLDWRVPLFALLLTVVVTCLFGLTPALRASSVQPATALRGGEDPHARGRVTRTLIALQVAFCFVVLFVAGLFVATFDRLAHRPTGFSAARVLTLDVTARRSQAPVFWDQLVEHLRDLPGVEAVGMGGWPLLGGGGWNGFVSVNGAPPNSVLAYFMSVSPGWMNAMGIRFVDGRDFRPADTFPGAAIVNETFAKEFFHGESPIGKMFAKDINRCQVVGIVHDAPYTNLREPIPPVAYVPIHGVDPKGTLQPIRTATIVVRTSSANPLALASRLRSEIPRLNSEYRISNIRTQSELVEAQTLRERLLAILALFFAVVALLLAGVGLYGVLDYSVLQRRREIGIRMAIGAQARDVARRVVSDVFVMVCLGAACGVGLGMAAARYIESLLYEVKATEADVLATPALAIAAMALLAAIPAVIRAVKIDPVITLRSE